MVEDAQSSKQSSPRSPKPAPPKPDGSDRLLGGRYRLQAVLGRGGMGTVWRARDEMLGRQVAVKELRLAGGMDEEEARRLVVRTLREAKATARIRHTGAVTVFDVVEEDDRPWIVMELVESRSLAEVLKEDGPLTPRRAAGIGLEVLGVLGAAHRHGVLHRDVKPSNVLVGEDGRVVLTDFGIASVEGDPSITSTGMLVGAPSYISPERARGQKPGPPADLWSLGATLYAMVEGRPPYDKGSALSTLTAVMTEPLAPPRNAGPLLPVIEGLLRKDPQERLAEPEAGRLLRAVADAPEEPAAEPEPSREQPTAPLAGPAATRPGPGAAGDGAAPAGRAQFGRVRVGARVPVPRDERPAQAPPTVVPAPPAAAPAAAGAGGPAGAAAPLIRPRQLAAVGVLVVLAVVGVLLARFQMGGGEGRQELGGGSGATHAASARPSATASASASSSASSSPSASAPAVPAGYTRYTGNGFSILVPPGFRQTSKPLDDNQASQAVAWQDAAGHLLQVGWMPSGGQSALSVWQATSQAGGWGNTSPMQVGATTFKGWPAATWEWTYGTPEKHVLDLGFTPDSAHWYAIAWRAPADEWDSAANQAMRTLVTASFRTTS